MPVSFAEAALGADIKVPTLGGAPVTLKIPPGTPNGRSFRVRGRGVQRKDGNKGDLLVTVEVQVPAHLDEKARAAVEALRDATGGVRPARQPVRRQHPSRELAVTAACRGAPRVPRCRSTSSASPPS